MMNSEIFDKLNEEFFAMEVEITYSDEVDTSAIDRLQAKADGLLDGTLDRKTSRVGKLQDRIAQLEGDSEAVGSPGIGGLQEKIERLHEGSEYEEYPNIKNSRQKVEAFKT